MKSTKWQINAPGVVAGCGGGPRASKRDVSILVSAARAQWMGEQARGWRSRGLGSRGCNPYSACAAPAQRAGVGALAVRARIRRTATLLSTTSSRALIVASCYLMHRPRQVTSIPNFTPPSIEISLTIRNSFCKTCIREIIWQDYIWYDLRCYLVANHRVTP